MIILHYLYVKTFCCFFLVLFLSPISSYAQRKISYERVNFKEIGSSELELLVFYPEKQYLKNDTPAIVFFFDGGWINGGKTQFINHAKYFAGRRLVSFLVDYRTESKYNTTPFESLKDAKSAIRYIRENASSFNINKNKIIVSGGSAGGH